MSRSRSRLLVASIGVLVAAGCSGGTAARPDSSGASNSAAGAAATAAQPVGERPWSRPRRPSRTPARSCRWTLRHRSCPTRPRPEPAVPALQVHDQQRHVGPGGHDRGLRRGRCTDSERARRRTGSTAAICRSRWSTTPTSRSSSTRPAAPYTSKSPATTGRTTGTMRSPSRDESSRRCSRRGPRATESDDFGCASTFRRRSSPLAAYDPGLRRPLSTVASRHSSGRCFAAAA